MISTKIPLPPQIIALCELFWQHNFDIYLVGGAVRDSLLNKIYTNSLKHKNPQRHKVISDFDFTTNALPSQMIEILSPHYKIFRVGEKYGTISVVCENIASAKIPRTNPKINHTQKIICEITTFRSESLYSDNRHPSEVVFGVSLKEDLKRRDFSINALAYEIKSAKIIDKFDGLLDLKRGVIKCIGEAQQRFSEDALRILRTFSFCSKLGFKIDKTTLDSAIAQKSLLSKISKERIKAESIKILQGKNAKFTLNLLKKHEILGIGRIPKHLENLPPSLRIFIGYEIFSDIFLQDRALEPLICEILAIRTKKYRQNKIALTKLAHKFGLINLRTALQITAKLNKKTRHLKKSLKTRHTRQNLTLNGNLIQKFLAANGREISGKEIGEIKNTLFEKVLKNELPNSTPQLLRYIRLTKMQKN